MKNLGRVLFRQRIKLDDYLIAGIEVLQKLLQMLLVCEPGSPDTEQTEAMLDLQLQLEDGYSLFLRSLEVLPALLLGIHVRGLLESEEDLCHLADLLN